MDHGADGRIAYWKDAVHPAYILFHLIHILPAFFKLFLIYKPGNRLHMEIKVMPLRADYVKKALHLIPVAFFKRSRVFYPEI